MYIKCCTYKAKKHKISRVSGFRTIQRVEVQLKKDNAQKTKGIIQYSAVWKKVLTQNGKNEGYRKSLNLILLHT